MTKRRRASRPPGSGTVFQRENGSFVLAINTIDPGTGKRVRRWETLKAKNKTEAHNEANVRIAKLADGDMLDPDKVTLSLFLERWLDHIKTAIEARTHERYSELCRSNIGPQLGATRLHDLTTEMIDAAYTKLLATGRKDGKGGLAPQTVIHIHRVLTKALKQAVIWKRLRVNPAENATLPKTRKTKLNTYYVDETAELLEAMRGTRMFTPAMIAVLCGLRRGEICALKWGSVDLDGATLSVVASMEQTKAGIRSKATKTDRERTVALSATVVEELRRHRTTQAQELLRVRRETFCRYPCCGSIRRPAIAAPEPHARMDAANRRRPPCPGYVSMI